MKQLSKLTAIALLIIPTVLSAQQRPGPGKPSGAGTGGPEMHDSANRVERLVSFLELSDAQRFQIEEAMAVQGESRRALAESLRSQHGALREMLESERPDPTAIGNRTLEIHGLRKQMAADHKAHLDAVRNLLTPEQAEKFEALMAARSFARGRDGDRPERERRGRGGAERRPRG